MTTEQATTKTTVSDVCTGCGESIADCPVRRQDGMRPGMCGICNDIATEIECGF